MTQEEINKILENHKHWLKRDYEGWEDMRANFCGVDLSGASICGADLRWANLHDANFSNAQFINTDLSYANLRGANLRNAVLVSANLSCASLKDADLRNANLRGANLMNADLRGNLDNADLNDADLREAVLAARDKDRLGVILSDNIIGYKKLRDGAICTLEIPVGNVVFSINHKKCRTQSAKVLKIEGPDGKERESGYSVSLDKTNNSLKYKVGEVVIPDSFSFFYNEECGGGIHFFKTIEEAREYKL